ncbi:tRNA modification GTPase MnmE [Chlamydia abortus]|nr:tRNA modification GTPase MnmE [Chlamydia abortus]
MLDTAGLRDTTDVVENIGIKKAISSIDEADVIIYLFEPSDLKINNNIKEKIKNKKNVLFVLNKTDLLTNKQKQTQEIKDMI